MSLASGFSGNTKMVSTIQLIILETMLITLAEFGPLSDFGARKTVHAGTGIFEYVSKGTNLQKRLIYSKSKTHSIHKTYTSQSHYHHKQQNNKQGS